MIGWFQQCEIQVQYKNMTSWNGKLSDNVLVKWIHVQVIASENQLIEKNEVMLLDNVKRVQIPLAIFAQLMFHHNTLNKWKNPTNIHYSISSWILKPKFDFLTSLQLSLKVYCLSRIKIIIMSCLSKTLNSKQANSIIHTKVKCTAAMMWLLKPVVAIRHRSIHGTASFRYCKT